MATNPSSARLPVGYRCYWDQECRFCNLMRKLGVALDWGRKVTFVPLQSDAAEIDLGHLSYDERMASSHLVTPEGRVYSRGEGALRLAALLPPTAPLVFLFRLLPGHLTLANRLYDWVANHRGVPYGGSCKVQFPESPSE